MVISSSSSSSSSNSPASSTFFSFSFSFSFSTSGVVSTFFATSCFSSFWSTFFSLSARTVRRTYRCYSQETKIILFAMITYSRFGRFGLMQRFRNRLCPSFGSLTHRTLHCRDRIGEFTSRTCPASRGRSGRRRHGCHLNGSGRLLCFGGRSSSER